MTAVNAASPSCARSVRRAVAAVLLAAGSLVAVAAPAAAESTQTWGKLTDVTMTTNNPSDWPWLIQPVPRSVEP